MAGPPHYAFGGERAAYTCISLFLFGLSLSVTRAAAHSIGVPVTGNWGRSLGPGLCQGWLEGAVGTLDSRKQGEASLFQEIFVLSSFLNHFSVVQQDSVLVSPACVPLNLFASLSISAEAPRMAQGGEWADIKKNLCRLYELLAINVVDTKELTLEVKKMADNVSYTSLQISNHDSRIDDNESNLREIMGKVDRIQEDLQRFIATNQVSRVNGEVAEAVLPMEEESVDQPRINRGNQ